jgi:hypothetical protein
MSKGKLHSRVKRCILINLVELEEITLASFLFGYQWEQKERNSERMNIAVRISA